MVNECPAEIEKGKKLLWKYEETRYFVPSYDPNKMLIHTYYSIINKNVDLRKNIGSKEESAVAGFFVFSQ